MGSENIRALSPEAYERRLTFFCDKLEVHRSTVNAIASGILDSPEDIGDAVQETMLLAWARMDQLNSSDAAYSWICAIARNVSLKILRSNSRHPAISIYETVNTGSRQGDPAMLADLLPQRGPGPEDVLMRSCTMENAGRAYEMLPEHYRRHIHMRYCMQMTPEAITSVLGISEQARRSACSRARRNMREYFRMLEESN